MTEEKTQPENTGVPAADTLSANTKENASKKPQAVEIGGRKGPEPTRYGDWEKNGIISDF